MLYSSQPREFLQVVPSGLLPALGVEENGREQIITESQVIMELLDRWHPERDGYKPMLPKDDDTKGWSQYDKLARLERELFSWWCTLVFRPETPSASISGVMAMFGGGDKEEQKMSGSMTGFLDCLSKVEEALSSTSGPWFFGEYDYPTMIDFVFVSHVERMLASCAFWKGLNLRDEASWKKKYPSLNAWLEAFEKRESYLAFKSDYYTHIMDIPPQYGPGFNGGFEKKRELYSKMINGRDNKSWNLPLSFDDELQPLFKGPPLPLSVLDAAGITEDEGSDGTYEMVPHEKMAKACRQMAGWKLSQNGEKVARFAARGASAGATNPRKTFGAELADPYAEPDEDAVPHVENVLRIVCAALLDDANYENGEEHLKALNSNWSGDLKEAVPKNMVVDVKSSLAYLRDRVGVPRDLPLASGRQLRAHLNWAIDTL